MTDLISAHNLHLNSVSSFKILAVVYGYLPYASAHIHIHL